MYFYTYVTFVYSDFFLRLIFQKKNAKPLKLLTAKSFPKIHSSDTNAFVSLVVSASFYFLITTQNKTSFFPALSIITSASRPPGYTSRPSYQTTNQNRSRETKLIPTNERAPVILRDLRPLMPQENYMFSVCKNFQRDPLNLFLVRTRVTELTLPTMGTGD